MSFIRVLSSGDREVLINVDKILSITKSRIKTEEEDDYDFELVQDSKTIFRKGKILGGGGIPIKSTDGKLIKILKFLNNKED